MGRNRVPEGGAAGAGAGKGNSTTNKEAAAAATARKKDKLSVSALLSMDQKPDKPNISKLKQKPITQSYTDGIDLPPSDDDADDSDEERNRLAANQRRTDRNPHIDQSKKLGKKEFRATRAIDQPAAKKGDLEDDRDPFTVAIGKSRASDDQQEGAANSKDISIEGFTVSVRGKELLKDAELKISHGRRYGLVGPNGKGKSTLLKLLAWRKLPLPKNMDVLLVEQEVAKDDRSALQVVVSADAELVKLRREVDAALQDDDAGDRVVELYDRLQQMGSDGAEARASKILAGLGFGVEMQARATRSLSGGERMRVSLAMALFVQPSLLLLDEPTNHLDLRAVLWLEEYLCRWKKTLVVVSHDRDFLNAVCNEIIHLDSKKLHMYRGNFDNFKREYEQRQKAESKRDETYAKLLKAAKRSGSKLQQEKVKDRASNCRRGKGKVVVDDGELPSIKAIGKRKEYKVEFHFPVPTELKRPLLQLVGVSYRHQDRADFTLSNLCVDVDMGTRVAIVGANGAGKSTLLKLLAGEFVPKDSADVMRNPNLRIGMYSQHFVDQLTMDETPVQYLMRLYPERFSKQQDVHEALGKFGLQCNHDTLIAKLSGGQKARVAFASISCSRPHVLLLDEPTNHLDMQSIDALANALDEFEGGVILVSHDSRLISSVCNNNDDGERKVSQIWVVKDGTVEIYEGTFEDYKEELLRVIRDEVDD
ncbi:unnamed protein product [Linum tenue]|uniref:ABC transporter domain-containing protein n=1 Tax=Linum tenue TaxID=586396 RepID=A0AAV0GTY1_9ROSI|nr:unnamed protein product [Linum tenue]